MFTSKEWDRVVCKRPRLIDEKKPLSKIIGLDSETLLNGKPFMFCAWSPEFLDSTGSPTSEGDCFNPSCVPDIFFTPRYVNGNFVLWNLKFDSGSLLSFLSFAQLHRLWEYGEIETPCHNVSIRYIPHKMLRFTRGKSIATFWDIKQYYDSSLDKAAKRYLNESKIEVRTKRFTPQYVARYWKSLEKYCMQDARLTCLLGNYLIRKLAEFDIETTALYSCASLAYTYFSRRSTIISGYKWFETCPEFLKMATDAYEGGKFEITARGSFDHGYEYDISSAYPCEIAQLVDLSSSRIVFSVKYQPHAVYGFIRCRIDNSQGMFLPCGIMEDKRVYPSGVYYTTITKKEYEYLLSLKVPVKIIKASWVFVSRKRYLYKKLIDHLYSIKSKYKGKDDMLYLVTKIVQNSFYGKLAQAIEDHDGKFITGSAWNPVYASEITANTRIKVCRIQNLLKDRCLAVHTDSAITLDPLPIDLVTGNLGEFSLETEGPGTIIACGQYEIGGKHPAFKGFDPPKDTTWKGLLERNKGRRSFNTKYLHVESWVEAMAKGHTDMVNVFYNDKKRIDLNADTKRLWPGDIRGRDLLSGLQHSVPRYFDEKKQPDFW